MKHQSLHLVDAGQSLVDSMRYVSHVSPVMTLYAVIVSSSTFRPPPAPSTPLSGADKSQEEEYESECLSKLGSAVERPAGDGI